MRMLPAADWNRGRVNMRCAALTVLVCAIMSVTLSCIRGSASIAAKSACIRAVDMMPIQGSRICGELRMSATRSRLAGSVRYAVTCAWVGCRSAGGPGRASGPGPKREPDQKPINNATAKVPARSTTHQRVARPSGSLSRLLRLNLSSCSSGIIEPTLPGFETMVPLPSPPYSTPKKVSDTFFGAGKGASPLLQALRQRTVPCRTPVAPLSHPCRGCRGGRAGVYFRRAGQSDNLMV